MNLCDVRPSADALLCVQELEQELTEQRGLTQAIIRHGSRARGSEELSQPSARYILHFIQFKHINTSSSVMTRTNAFVLHASYSGIFLKVSAVKQTRGLHCIFRAKSPPGCKGRKWDRKNKGTKRGKET